MLQQRRNNPGGTIRCTSRNERASANGSIGALIGNGLCVFGSGVARAFGTLLLLLVIKGYTVRCVRRTKKAGWPASAFTFEECHMLYLLWDPHLVILTMLEPFIHVHIGNESQKGPTQAAGGRVSYSRQTLSGPRPCCEDPEGYHQGLAEVGAINKQSRPVDKQHRLSIFQHSRSPYFGWHNLCLPCLRKPLSPCSHHQHRHVCLFTCPRSVYLSRHLAAAQSRARPICRSWLAWTVSRASQAAITVARSSESPVTSSLPFLAVAVAVSLFPPHMTLMASSRDLYRNLGIEFGDIDLNNPHRFRSLHENLFRTLKTIGQTRYNEWQARLRAFLRRLGCQKDIASAMKPKRTTNGKVSLCKS